MMAGSHVAVGLATWAWAAPRLGFPALDPFALSLAIGGALLPDIDHPQSWVGRRVRVISHPLAAVIGHRGFTHSILAVVGCGLLLRWRGVGRAAVDPLVVGYLSHLAADLMTSGGLRLAWPSRRRFAIPLCKTGSPGELVIVMSLVVWVSATTLGVSPALGLEHLMSPSAWVHPKGTATSSP
jgi:inner membrane protein